MQTTSGYVVPNCFVKLCAFKNPFLDVVEILEKPSKLAAHLDNHYFGALNQFDMGHKIIFVAIFRDF